MIKSCQDRKRGCSSTSQWHLTSQAELLHFPWPGSPSEQGEKEEEENIQENFFTWLCLTFSDSLMPWVDPFSSASSFLTSSSSTNLFSWSRVVVVVFLLFVFLPSASSYINSSFLVSCTRFLGLESSLNESVLPHRSVFEPGIRRLTDFENVQGLFSEFIYWTQLFAHYITFYVTENVSKASPLTFFMTTNQKHKNSGKNTAEHSYSEECPFISWNVSDHLRTQYHAKVSNGYRGRSVYKEKHGICRHWSRLCVSSYRCHWILLPI